MFVPFRKKPKTQTMKSLSQFFFAAAFIICFSGCTRDDSVFNCKFYTSINSNEATLTLFIDGVNKGTLPYISTAPACGDSLISQTLQLQLESGRYKFEARDASGTVKSYSKVKITERTKSVNGNMGGISITGTEDCEVINLFY